jgi:hypothetical protein
VLVRALKSFGGSDGRGHRVHHSAGDIFELPDGADWLRAGLVEAHPLERETAALEPPEKAVMPRPRKRAGSKQ